MQWEAGLARAGVDVRVAHVAEVLSESLGEPRPGDPTPATG
jgi:hypothetical protein